MTGMRGKKCKIGITTFVTILSVFSVVMQGFTVCATAEEPVPTGPDWAMDAAAAPAVVAEGAILMDVDTGVVFYEKNIHEKYYPASITKLLTCLVAAENSELTDIVKFSHEAVFGIESGSSHIGIDEGEELTMKDCYYGALLESANEVCSGIAEHVGGSVEGFAAMMNEKVKELGGNESNFVNANGLHNDNHYTSAYDMALIGQAFAKNEMLLEISGTDFYHIDATAAQPDEIDLRHHHRMLPGCQLSKARPYEYMIGGKNGFTSIARTTLVTFAKKDGHRLVCVLLKDENPHHYTDTLSLFEYGFACYENPSLKDQIDAKTKELQGKQEVSENETSEDGIVAASAGTAALGDGAGISAGGNGTEGLGLDEMDRRVDNVGKDKASGRIGEADAEKEVRYKTGKGQTGSIPVLTIVVTIVAAAAVSVCGVIFYRNYMQEMERRRRRAEIMARHRARREAG